MTGTSTPRLTFSRRRGACKEDTGRGPREADSRVPIGSLGYFLQFQPAAVSRVPKGIIGPIQK